MEKSCDAMNPSKNEKKIIGQWFACIFKSTKTSNFYIGKVRKRFLTAKANEQGYVAAVKMDYLRLKLRVTDCIFWEHKTPLKDNDVIPIKDVFMGPLKGIYCENGKWEFPQCLMFRRSLKK